VNAPDWYGGPTEKRVYGPLSRAKTGNPGSIDQTGAYLYETVITVDPTKSVDSIDFSWNGGEDTAVANIFAVSGVNIKYAVTYDGNGNTEGTVPTDSNSPYENNAKVTIADAGTLQKSGYAFNNWNTVASPTTENHGTSYAGGDEFNITSNTTLYAQWEVLPATAPTVSGAADLSLTYDYTEGSLSVTATAATDTTYNDLTYQWYSNTTASSSGGTAINTTNEPTAATDTYTIPTGKSADKYYYYCEVTATRTDNNQTATVTSEVATVTIRGAISQTVTFKVENGSWNEGEGDAATTDKTVNLTGYEGDKLKLTEDQIPAVGSKPKDNTYKAEVGI
jgi:hypothetical protein